MVNRNSIRIVITLAVASMGWSSHPARAADIVADYRFHNSLESNIGAVPDLAPLGPGNNCYVADTVNQETRYVLGFPYGNGLSLSPTTDLIPSDRYSVVMDMRLDSVSGYHRLISFDNGVADCGFYVLNGTLNFYCVTGGTGAIPIKTYTQIAITRDSSGLVKGYINGEQDLSFDDTTSRAVIGGDHILRFFRDNECPGACSEHSVGAVSRIRLWNDALPAEDLQALTTEMVTTTTLELDCGDANGSNTITAGDALTTLKAAVGTACCVVICDVNDSGTVTASDALAILKKAVGQDVTLTCPF